MGMRVPHYVQTIKSELNMKFQVLQMKGFQDLANHKLQTTKIFIFNKLYVDVQLDKRHTQGLKLKHNNGTEVCT